LGQGVARERKKVDMLTFQYRQSEIKNIVEDLLQKAELETFEFLSNITPDEIR